MTPRSVSAMNIDQLVRMFTAIALTVLILAFGSRMFEEACDAADGWPCGVADDGWHDGQFNWRHGVLPW